MLKDNASIAEQLRHDWLCGKLGEGIQTPPAAFPGQTAAIGEILAESLPCRAGGFQWRDVYFSRPPCGPTTYNVWKETWCAKNQYLCKCTECGAYTAIQYGEAAGGPSWSWNEGTFEWIK